MVKQKNRRLANEIIALELEILDKSMELGDLKKIRNDKLKALHEAELDNTPTLDDYHGEEAKEGLEDMEKGEGS